MGRRTIASDNRVGTGGSQFPKIRFANKGERKRILLIDQAGPWQEYVHYIKEPIFVDEAPKMVTRTKPRSDEEFQDYDTALLSMPLCLGDEAVITELGYDDKNCPVCAEVRQAPAAARLVPVLRFAANVVDYVLRPGTWNVQKPFSASVKIWNFTSNTYDEIVSLQEQNGELIRVRDLTLECTNAMFNQAKLGVMPVPGWQELGAGPQLTELLAEEGNVASDAQLRDSCGRAVKRAFMEEDVAISLRKWAKAIAWNERGGAVVAAGVSLGGGQQDQSLAAGVGELLGSGPSLQDQADIAAMQQQVAASSAAAKAGGDPLAGLGEFAPDPLAPATPPAPPPAQNAAPSPAPGPAPQPASADPFAVLGGSPGPASAPSPAPAAGAAGNGASTPSAPPSDPFAALGEGPAAAPAPGPEGDGQQTSFDALVQGLGG